MKSITELMSDNPEKLNEFSQACDELVATRYILAESKLTKVLKVIATSKLIYDMFDKNLKGFDYKGTAKKCMTLSNGTNRSIVLPEDNVAKLNFVFCLLVDIENHNIYFNDFLREFYFTSNDINIAFDEFCREIIIPFKETLLSAFN